MVLVAGLHEKSIRISSWLWPPYCHRRRAQNDATCHEPSVLNPKSNGPWVNEHFLGVNSIDTSLDLRRDRYVLWTDIWVHILLTIIITSGLSLRLTISSFRLVNIWKKLISESQTTKSEGAVLFMHDWSKSLTFYLDVLSLLFKKWVRSHWT